MTPTLEVRPTTLYEAPSAAPATFNVAVGAGPVTTMGLGRTGHLAGRIELAVGGRTLTITGTNHPRKTMVRTAVHWTAFLAAWAILAVALWWVAPLWLAIGAGAGVALLAVALLEWTRRRTATGELALSDVTVEKIKGRRLWLKGPFELERPEARPTLLVHARTKEDAAALAQLLG